MTDDVAAAYGSQLLDLKMNSKPMINVLTMMAEDYIRHAPVVVQTIERHLNRVHPGVKLPVLYLIDSIVKNVKKDYENLFVQNIVSTFCGVFEKVDDKVKLQMFKLRQTWTDVFPQRKLYAIDVRCHQVDKNWPISAPPSNNASIHVNPRFLNTGRPSPAVSAPITTQLVPSTPPEQPPAADVTEAQMRAKLLQKKKELLELQQKKIELELMQTKAAIETKQLEEMESAMKQEKMLLQQAEKAKSKTDIAHQILSTYPKLPLSVPSVAVVPTPPISSGAPAMTDPRLNKQMESKARSDVAVLKSERRSPSTIKLKTENAPTKPTSRTAHDSSVTIPKPNMNPLESLQNKTVIIIPVTEPEGRKKNHDMVEIDMFQSSSRKQKDQSRSVSKEKDHLKDKREKDSKNKKSSSSKESNSRDRSRSSDRGYPTSIHKEKKSKDKDVKKYLPELVESNDDYENEMEGFSGLKIKPKRSTVSELEKELASPVLSSQSPNSEGGREGSFDRRTQSPEKRSRSRTSSERSDKDRKEKESKHFSNKDKKELKVKTRDKEKRSPIKSNEREGSVNTTKIDEWKNYDARQKAVLKRNYRKTTGVELEEEENKVPNTLQESAGDGSSVVSDVDLRFQGLKDVDLRQESDGIHSEPPSKKTRSSGNIIDDLFGREDVDLRQPRSGSWSQMKKPSRGDEEPLENSQMDEDIREILQQQNRNRPPPPISPAHSVSSVRSSCDPLGRPRLYDKLPDDPEERKRSLDTRSHTVDPVEHFRREYIDRALNGKGELSHMDVKQIFSKAQEHVDEGILNTEQYLAVMKQISQINEASAMREVQQMQMRTPNWQEQNSNLANPWNGPVGVPIQGPWAASEFRPRGPADCPTIPRFPPGGSNNWGPRMNMGVPWNNQSLPGPRGPNPFEEALLKPRMDDLIPRVNEMELRVAERDTASSIPIDKVPRQLRFYGDTAVILMGMMADEPKQIAFQRDGRPRTILINGKPMELTIGEVKRFELNRKQHTLKIGAPTRELYIDDRHYEVCFGGPAVRIPVDGRIHTFELTAPPPQVEFGKVTRHDLVAGRVNLIVDAVEQLTLYLDEKPQKLDLFSEPVILRFCDGFHTVTLNGRPFPTNFGARLPFTVTIPNSGQHYFRFSAVTAAAEKGIGNFIRARQGGHMEMEDAISESFGSFRGRGRGIRGGRGRGRGRDYIIEHSMPPVVDRNPLDMLTNLFPSPRVPDSSDERKFRKMGEKVHSYESEIRGDAEKESTEESSEQLDVSNILALAARLGLLPSVASVASAGETNVEENEIPKLESPTEKLEEKEKVVEKEKEIEKPTVPPLATVDVSLVSDEKNYFKERRSTLITQLWTGVQCASCGLRFPPDQTVRYSQHLDWHFRHNRREKANSKKAQSRKWYYDLSDWIQFEEVEDLEERAASLFEIQEEAENDQKSPSAVMSLDEYTILASGHEGVACPQCGETFDTFFDEEKEEWRLKDALIDEIEGETKVYHPVCHQDYLKSLVEESMDVDAESVTDVQSIHVDDEIKEVDSKVQEDEDDEVLILKEGKKEIVLMEIDVDEEDGFGKDTDKSNDTEKNNKESENGPSLNTDKQNSENIPVENLADKPVSSYIILSKSVQSPITINDEDSSSNMLPGISEDSGGGVFGFALNSGISREGSDSPVPIEERKIVYKSMKFDFPNIKLEPPDELPEKELQDNFIEAIELEQQSVVHDTDRLEHVEDTEQMVSLIEPVNIDLTADDDDSMDEVDGSSRPFGQMTAIDGNLQQEESVPMPFAPPVKIRINISGLDVGASSKSPSSKPDNEPPVESVLELPIQPILNSTDGTKSTSPGSVGDNIVENKQNSEIVFTEEMKRLKPRLVGRKLVNCPPKQLGKEESGLCVIC